MQYTVAEWIGKSFWLQLILVSLISIRPHGLEFLSILARMRMSKPSSLRAFILLALTRMAEVALADGMEGQYWQARIQEAWQESVEWWSKVYKVTWSDQPQNVYAFAFALLTSVTIVIIRYNLLAIGASFIVVVVSLILGSRHITRTMEEEAHIAAAALTADEDVSTEEGPGDASGDDRSKATKKKVAKTSSSSSKARGRSTERQAEDVQSPKRSTKARSSSRASRAAPSPARSESKSGKGTPKSSTKRRSSRARA